MLPIPLLLLLLLLLLQSCTRSESIRTGFMLSQGGEFAFVLLSLACQLKLLPNDLNQILIITVVCSMALTPALAQLGQVLGDFVETRSLGSSDGQEEGQTAAAVALVSRGR
jgi:Kef-type K+ transport system membrane component KefB